MSFETSLAILNANPTFIFAQYVFAIYLLKFDSLEESTSSQSIQFEKMLFAKKIEFYLLKEI
jgi:hypothetical protein